MDDKDDADDVDMVVLMPDMDPLPVAVAFTVRLEVMSDVGEVVLE